MILVKAIVLNIDYVLFLGVLFLSLFLCVFCIILSIKTVKSKQQHIKLIWYYENKINRLSKKTDAFTSNNDFYDIKKLEFEVSQIKDKIISLRVIINSLNSR